MSFVGFVGLVGLAMHAVHGRIVRRPQSVIGKSENHSVRCSAATANWQDTIRFPCFPEQITLVSLAEGDLPQFGFHLDTIRVPVQPILSHQFNVRPPFNHHHLAAGHVLSPLHRAVLNQLATCEH